MFKHSKVVIGIPVFNEENYIAETLKSLQNQSYHDFIVVISDNASTDRSGLICREFCERDSRFVYIKQDMNIGSANNFSFLFEKTQSEYFMWLGGHDLIEKDFLEKHISFMEKNQAYSLSYSYVRCINEDGKTLRISDGGNYLYPNTSPLRRYLNSVRDLTECTAVNNLFRRAFLEGIVIVPVVGPDHIILSRLLYKGPFNRFEEPLYIRRFFASTKISYMEKVVGSSAPVNYWSHCKFYLEDMFKLVELSVFSRCSIAIQICLILDKRYSIFGLFNPVRLFNRFYKKINQLSKKIFGL